MRISREPASETTWVAVAAVGYAVLIYAVLPAGIVALDDDFGYVRSVVLTLQHGRPWTDDWLEPWTAGLSALSATLYHATGSFYFGTYGLLAMLAGLSFFFFGLLLREKGAGAGRSILFALLTLTFPTFLWKTVQFTGMALYIPCLLGALWSAQKRRWPLFTTLWLLAIATRQSAITWAVLPVAAWAKDRLAGNRTWGRAAFQTTLVLACGAVLFRWLGRFMNKTHAQLLTSDQMWSHWSIPQAFRIAAIGAGLFLLVLGLAGAWSIVNAPCSLPQSRAGWAIRVIGAAAILSLLTVGTHDFVAFDHAALDGPIGTYELKGLVVLAAAGLLAGRLSFDLVPLAGAVASLAALTFRGELWDYYAIDLMVLFFFAFAAPAEPIPVAGIGSGRWRLQTGVVGVLAVFHLCFIGHFKHRLDRGYALCCMGSRALSEGRLHPDELSFIPFGLGG